MRTLGMIFILSLSIQASGRVVGEIGFDNFLECQAYDANNRRAGMLTTIDKFNHARDDYDTVFSYYNRAGQLVETKQLPFVNSGYEPGHSTMIYSGSRLQVILHQIQGADGRWVREITVQGRHKLFGRSCVW